MKIYRVTLTPDDEKNCRAIIGHGQNKAEMIRRAYTLLKSHDGKTDVAIAADLYIDDETVRRTRVRYVLEGLSVALNPETEAGNDPLLNDGQIGRLTTLACSAAPEGQKRWTHQLLAEQMVVQGVVAAISASTVGRYLKKTSSNPGK